MHIKLIVYLDILLLGIFLYMKRKMGLVLDGGGAKGAYHIGVFKALKEFNIYRDIKVISGSSVGALNACLFPIYNLNFQIVENIWINETEDKIFTLEPNKIINSLFKTNKFNNTLNTVLSSFLDDDVSLMAFINFISSSGVFSRDGLIEIMDKYLKEDVIKSINVYACCTNSYSIKPYYFKLKNYSLNKIKKILLASSAIPILFPPENIQGESYFDGGVSDNSPINALKNEKCTDIIAVHLKKSVNSNIYKNSLFKGVNIYELYPQKDLGDFFDGTLNFSSDFIRKCMNQGYIDALDLVKNIMY